MILAVQVDGSTITIAAAGLTAIVGLLSQFTTRGKSLNDEADRIRAALREELAEAKAEIRELKTEVEKWQRRAESAWGVNTGGGKPWPD